MRFTLGGFRASCMSGHVWGRAKGRNQLLISSSNHLTMMDGVKSYKYVKQGQARDGRVIAKGEEPSPHQRTSAQQLQFDYDRWPHNVSLRKTRR